MEKVTETLSPFGERIFGVPERARESWRASQREPERAREAQRGPERVRVSQTASQRELQ